ncbi:MAG: hypothetical protein ABI871_00505 [Chthoniobacterales bacterium]
MCLALYIASAKPLALIPWEEANPAFFVTNLPDYAQRVRKHFQKENVYYVGSYQGCSCAFNYEHEYDSIARLYNFLREAVSRTGELEAFACQTGNEGKEAKHSLIASPRWLALPEFSFKDRQFIQIRSGGRASPFPELQALESASPPAKRSSSAGTKRARKGRTAKVAGTRRKRNASGKTKLERGDQRSSANRGNHAATR